MKKVIFILLSLILCSCAFRSDYYTLYVDDYQFSVGYDNVKYLKNTFDLDIADTLDSNETVENIDVKLFGSRFCTVDVRNDSDKSIDSNEAIISKLTIYCDDVGDRAYKINDVELDDSVTSNCEKLSGSLVNRNGVVCVIESNKSGNLNVIELHGDILAIDQDKLDHIVIYIK